jgi:hypothetical protein
MEITIKLETVMKKNIIYSIMCVTALILGGCHDEQYVDPTVTDPGITSVSAQMLSGTLSGLEYKCTVTDPNATNYIIPVQWYYPEESDTETTDDMMKSAKLSAVLPNNVSLSPTLGIVDLTQDNYYTLTEPNGKQSKICIKGQRTHSSACTITSFEIGGEWGITGVIDETNSTIAIPAIDTDDMSSVDVTVEHSYHATITAPIGEVKVDNATCTLSGVNLNSPVTFTVTADDGTTHDYTVKKELPDKIAYGYRSGSEKQMFSLDISSFAHGTRPTLAAVDKYLIICVGDGTTPSYINRKTGAVGGSIVKGSANYDGSITGDAAGNMLIADHADPDGTFKIYSTNSVATAPTQLLSWTNTTGFPLGDHIAVQGNIKGSALIVATCGPLEGVSDGYSFVYWPVVGGVVGTPSVVNITGYSWWATVKVIPRGLTAADGFFFSYYQGNTNYFNGLAYVNASGAVTATLNEDQRDYYSSNFCNDKYDGKTFNNANYVGLICSNYFGTWPSNSLYVFDMTNMNNFTGSLDNSKCLTYLYDINSENFPGDGNTIGDVLLAPTVDGYYMQIFLIDYTYNMLQGYQVDCIKR